MIMLKPVQSKMISAIGHNPETGELHVRFNNGQQYKYDGVTSAQHADLMNAASVGKHFGEHIRGQFAHSKVA